MRISFQREQRQARRVARLRRAVFSLSAPTREAMLVGIRSQEIIVGDYTSLDGGVCPMLAAHRSGTRSDFKDFARAWDGVGATRRARPATRRELDVLLALLEESVDGAGSGPMAPQRGEERESEPAQSPACPVLTGPR